MDVMNHPMKKAAQKVYGDEPKNLDEIGHAVIKMIDNWQMIDNLGGKNKKKLTTDCAGLCWKLTYAPRVSNTHSAPLNGKTNWGHYSKDAPTGYPGFSGRIWVRYGKQGHTFGSDPLRGALVHTGTGGFGSYDGPWQHVYHCYRERSKFCNLKSVKKLEPIVYSWDFKIFVDDWPLVKDWVEKAETFNILRGQNTQIKHEFFWEADWIREFDSKYLLNPEYEKGFPKELIKSFA